MSNLYTPNSMMNIVNADESDPATYVNDGYSSANSYQLMHKVRFVDLGTVMTETADSTPTNPKQAYSIDASESGTVFTNETVDSASYQTAFYLPYAEEGMIFTFFLSNPFVNADLDPGAGQFFNTQFIFPRWSGTDNDGDTFEWLMTRANNLMNIYPSSSTVDGSNVTITFIGTRSKIWRIFRRPAKKATWTNYEYGAGQNFSTNWGKADAFNDADTYTTLHPASSSPRAWSNPAWYYYPPGVENGLITKTSDYTVQTSENGAIFTNAGAAGNVEFTLPSAQAGLHYMFVDAVNGKKIVVTAGAGDLIQPATREPGLQDQTSINSCGIFGSAWQSRGYSIWLMAADDTHWMTMGGSAGWGDGAGPAV